MNTKQAISQLENLQCHCQEYIDKDDEDSIWRKDVQALDIAIKAVEKEIPKKPIKNKEQNIRYASSYSCPKCGGRFSGTGIADYCYHCGQKLDWEVAKNER